MRFLVRTAYIEIRIHAFKIARDNHAKVVFSSQSFLQRPSYSRAADKTVMRDEHKEAGKAQTQEDTNMSVSAVSFNGNVFIGPWYQG